MSKDRPGGTTAASATSLHYEPQCITRIGTLKSLTIVDVETSLFEFGPQALTAAASTINEQIAEVTWTGRFTNAEVTIQSPNDGIHGELRAALPVRRRHV